MCFPFLSTSTIIKTVILITMALLVMCIIPYASDRGVSMCRLLFREPICHNSVSRVLLGFFAIVCDTILPPS
jgi:hypothetical protein